MGVNRTLRPAAALAAGCVLALAAPAARADDLAEAGHQALKMTWGVPEVGGGEVTSSWEDPSGTDSWRTPNRWRTGAELGLVITIGAAWYWIDRERQVGDWDFPSWRDRFSTDILINDTNPFEVNYSWHAFGGASYHVTARSNDLGVIESALWGLGTSLAWEYGIEYREKADLNDIIFTTPAGVAAGEFLHWLGRYIQRAPSGTGWDALRWTLGLPQTFHDTLDGRRGGARGPEIAHHFRLSSGVGGASSDRQEGAMVSERSGTLYHLRFEGALTAFDDLLPHGVARRGFRDANFTTVAARVTGGSEQYGGTYALADTFIAGWRFTNVGERAGSALNLGTAVAVRYQRENYGVWEDRLGVAHLPGLAVDSDTWGPSWRLRAKARLHGDYAGVQSLAAGQWREAHPDEVGKSVIDAQGYYYAWGLSGRLQAELSVSRLDLGGALFYGRYRSQQGFDRFQDDVTIDQIVNDRFLDYELWLRGALFRDSFLELRASGLDRSERFEEFDASARLSRYSVELGTTF